MSKCALYPDRESGGFILAVEDDDKARIRVVIERDVARSLGQYLFMRTRPYGDRFSWQSSAPTGWDEMNL